MTSMRENHQLVCDGALFIEKNWIIHVEICLVENKYSWNIWKSIQSVKCDTPDNSLSCIGTAFDTIESRRKHLNLIILCISHGKIWATKERNLGIIEKKRPRRIKVSCLAQEHRSPCYGDKCRRSVTEIIAFGIWMVQTNSKSCNNRNERYREYYFYQRKSEHAVFDWEHNYLSHQMRL